MIECDKRIVGIALKLFRETLVDIAEGEWVDRAGEPPSHGFVGLRNKTKKGLPVPTAPPLRQWRITTETVAEMEPDEADFKPSYGAGMFFDRFLGRFEVAEDQMSFEIGWQTGPRYGRGFVYEIELFQETGFRLGRPRCIWAS